MKIKLIDFLGESTILDVDPDGIPLANFVEHEDNFYRYESMEAINAKWTGPAFKQCPPPLKLKVVKHEQS